MFLIVQDDEDEVYICTACEAQIWVVRTDGFMDCAECGETFINEGMAVYDETLGPEE